MPFKIIEQELSMTPSNENHQDFMNKKVYRRSLGGNCLVFQTQKGHLATILMHVRKLHQVFFDQKTILNCTKKVRYTC